MQTKIATWGNSSAVRLPAELLIEAGLTPGAAVRVRKVKSGLLIEPAAPRYTLAELLKKVTVGNTPAEIDWGQPRGREALE